MCDCVSEKGKKMEKRSLKECLNDIGVMLRRLIAEKEALIIENEKLKEKLKAYEK